MFKLFKVVLISCLLILMQQISYAETDGFELIVNLPIGAGITLIENNVAVDGNPKGGGNFQTGLEANIGYMFQIKENMGFSILGSIGYSFTGFNYSKNNNSQIYNIKTHDIYLGIYPKFNIERFSIGINVGAKFSLDSQFNYRSFVSSKTFSSTSEPRTYIKGTFDYSIFFKDNMAFNAGFYIGYDFGWSWTDVSKNINVVKNETYGNLDIGIQLGYRFGPEF